MADEEETDNKENEGAQATENEEGAEGEDGEGEGEGKKSKKMLFIIIGAVAVLLIGGGAAAYFLGFIGGDKAVEESHEGEHADEKHAKEDGKKDKKKGKDDGHGGEKGGGSAFVEIPPMIVNLNADDSPSRFLRLSVQLELEDPSEKEAVEAIMPRVIDQFQTYLRELRVEDLRGSAGIYRLQMELLWRVNQAAYPIKVKSVLFQEILIQ